jgi:hypothetical protein
MEGSMKMMSWSRYHFLPNSLSRAARRCRATRLIKSRQRARFGASADAQTWPGAEASMTARSLVE